MAKKEQEISQLENQIAEATSLEEFMGPMRDYLVKTEKSPMMMLTMMDIIIKSRSYDDMLAKNGPEELVQELAYKHDFSEKPAELFARFLYKQVMEKLDKEENTSKRKLKN
jgi:hypothetical protein